MLKRFLCGVHQGLIPVLMSLCAISHVLLSRTCFLLGERHPLTVSTHLFLNPCIMSGGGGYCPSDVTQVAMHPFNYHMA